MAIGDGWTYPYEQAVYSGMAYDIGVIDEKQKAEMQYHEAQLKEKIWWGEYPEAWTAMGTLMSYIQNATGGLDEYNVRQYGNPNEPQFDEFLNTTWAK